MVQKFPAGHIRTGTKISDDGRLKTITGWSFNSSGQNLGDGMLISETWFAANDFYSRSEESISCNPVCLETRIIHTQKGYKGGRSFSRGYQVEDLKSCIYKKLFPWEK